MRDRKVKSLTRKIMVENLGYVKTEEMRSNMPVFTRNVLVNATQLYNKISTAKNHVDLGNILAEINCAIHSLEFKFSKEMRDRAVDIIEETYDIELSWYQRESVLSALYDHTDYTFSMESPWTMTPSLAEITLTATTEEQTLEKVRVGLNIK